MDFGRKHQMSEITACTDFQDKRFPTLHEKSLLLRLRLTVETVWKAVCLSPHRQPQRCIDLHLLL